MTATQTVHIPADHKLTIDVPCEVPEGPVVITFTTAAPVRKSIARHFGRLKNSSAFAGDPMEIQRQMRAEWND